VKKKTTGVILHKIFMNKDFGLVLLEGKYGLIEQEEHC
jgi:hypothetical protein